MKQPAPSAMVSLVGDRHTVKLDSLDRRSGLKELRSMRKRSFRIGERERKRKRAEEGKRKESDLYKEKGETRCLQSTSHASTTCITCSVDTNPIIGRGHVGLLQGCGKSLSPVSFNSSHWQYNAPSNKRVHGVLISTDLSIDFTTNRMRSGEKAGSRQKQRGPHQSVIQYKQQCNTYWYTVDKKRLLGVPVV